MSAVYDDAGPGAALSPGPDTQHSASREILQVEEEHRRNTGGTQEEHRRNRGIRCDLYPIPRRKYRAERSSPYSTKPVGKNYI